MSIFLSGGGNKVDSLLLDKAFAKTLKTGGTLVYIPVAMEKSKYTKCLAWFKSVFEPLWNGNICMLTDLNQIKDISNICGVYMGGGNTVKLLSAITSGLFNNFLHKLIIDGVPLYGGSAGAIVLGKTIKTAPETKKNINECSGLNMLHDHSVVCHYNSNDYMSAMQLSKELDQSLIVLSEQSGLMIDQNRLYSFGGKPTVLINKNKIIYIHSGHCRTF